MSPVGEEHLVEFVENQDHVAVLAALQKFVDNPELLLLGLKVLLPLAGPGNSFTAGRHSHGEATEVVFITDVPHHLSHSFITTVYSWHQMMMMSLKACECMSAVRAGTSSHEGETHTDSAAFGHSETSECQSFRPRRVCL